MGPGPGPLLAAAETWRSLAAQYANAATELAAILASVQETAWEGESAERFIAAHQPFLCWLNEVSAVATAAAASHETAAAGYTSAFGSMPTLAELAANHSLHAALVATNFFGMNTIPIALVEADYLRMWIQSASTMSTYQAVSAEGLTTTPATTPAPEIVATAGSGSDRSFPDPVTWIREPLQDFLDLLSTLAAQFLSEPLGKFIVQVLNAFISLISSNFQMIVDMAWKPLLSPVLLPIGLGGLTGVCIPGEGFGPPFNISGPEEPGSHSLPMTTGATPVTTSPAAPAAPAATNAPTATIAPTPASAPPQVFAADQDLYAVGGPDGEGFTPTTRTNTVASVGTDAPATKLLTEKPEASGAKKNTKPRRRPRKYRVEILEDRGRMAISDDGAAERTVAAGEGMGTLGFAGTCPKSATTPARGLTRLVDREFGEAPRAPMLPHTWSGEETI